MPESSVLAGMIAAAGPIAALLIPVVILLFVALRLRKKLRYPHGLLYPHIERKRNAALPRTLRLYFDVLIDSACAIIIGLAIAGSLRPARQRGPATVIDTSLSMIRGIRGDRPLDEAARLIFSDESLLASSIFSLGWDPVARSPYLRDVTNILASSSSPQAFVLALESTEAFMSADYSLVSGLSRRRWSDITLISDDAALQSAGITIQSMAARPPRYLYPASAAWDRELERGVVRFVSGGGVSLEALWRVADDGSLERARPEDYSLASGPSGFELSFDTQAVWAVQWDGHILPFLSPAKTARVSSVGTFSARIVDALGPIASRQADKPLARGEKGLTIRDSGGAGIPAYISLAKTETEPFLIPPRLTLGQVVAAGYSRNSDLALGPAALSSVETVIPFWLAMNSHTNEEPRPRTRPIRVGEGFLYRRDDGLAPLLVVPAIEEYAPSQKRVLVRKGIEADGRLVITLMLAALYGLKLWLGFRRVSRNRKPN